MPDILSLPVRDFLAATAAKSPTPGGGSIAALIGAALAASLAAMALEYTVGKKAFAPHDAEIRSALTQFQIASKMFQELITEDIAAYEALSELLKLPPDQRLAHPDYAATVVAAIRAPQAAAGFALNILTLAGTLKDKTNKHLLSDLAIAAVYAHATVHASEFNVRVNLPLLPNQQEAAALKESLAALVTKADTLYAPLRHRNLSPACKIPPHPSPAQCRHTSHFSFPLYLHPHESSGIPSAHRRPPARPPRIHLHHLATTRHPRLHPRPRQNPRRLRRRSPRQQRLHLLFSRNHLQLRLQRPPPTLLIRSSPFPPMATNPGPTTSSPATAAPRIS